jgi:hypothetical protein
MHYIGRLELTMPAIEQVIGCDCVRQPAKCLTCPAKRGLERANERESPATEANGHAVRPVEPAMATMGPATARTMPASESMEPAEHRQRHTLYRTDAAYDARNHASAARHHANRRQEPATKSFHPAKQSTLHAEQVHQPATEAMKPATGAMLAARTLARLGRLQPESDGLVKPQERREARRCHGGTSVHEAVDAHRRANPVGGYIGLAPGAAGAAESPDVT